MARLWVSIALLSLTAHTICSPITQKKPALKRQVANEEEKDTLLEGDTIIDHIYKVNKDNDVNMYEADIQLGPDDVVDTRNSGDVDASLISVRRKRNAARDRKKLWVNRVVPYEYDSSLPASYHPTIEEAIVEYEQKTCLKFVRRTNENLFIKFIHDKGCWSPVGRQYWMTGLGQELSLGNGCNHKGTIMHELMHAVGFWHEQSRPDRNLYVEILWENINDGEDYNFNKYNRHDIDVLQVPYDFDSIMHYGKKSFSKNGKDTIRSVLDPSRSLGQRNGFTDTDIHEINALYDCSNQAGGWSSWSQYGPCSLQCYKYRQRFCTSNYPSIDCPGADQYGVEKESAFCNASECHAPIDGHWGRWSPWGECNATCGYGTQSRTRSCDDPSPKNGGKSCVGSDKSTQSCKKRSCGIGPRDCEFDYDEFCDWKNDKNNPSNYNWQRESGATGSSSTGPSGDHTSGSGYYIYVEASGVAQDERAQLHSDFFSATSGQCLTFWYHMYGTGIGELNVYVKPVSGAMKKVWSLSGDQGDEWNMAQVTLSSTETYTVVFEGVRGGNFRADIALDDVRFVDSPCFEAIGCYKDTYSRALPLLVKDLRLEIDWYKIGKTIENCATLTQEKSLKTFALQFYGECWSDDTGAADYARYGEAQPGECWEGVGKHWTNFVYKII